MPQKNKVRYTPAAVDDMDEIFSYISTDNIAAAEKILQKLDSSIARLGDFPIWAQYYRKTNTQLFNQVIAS